MNSRIHGLRTGSPPFRLLTACALAMAALLAGAIAHADAQTTSRLNTHALTLYSVTKSEQFVNNEDDRARGEGNNPFGNYSDTPATVEKGTGPFAGDEALFAFDLYSNASLTKRAGSAVFTCQYNFDKNTFCDASFQLNGGTLIAAGAFNFHATTFELAVTGGYGKYGSAVGEIKESPAMHAQRLAFSLA